MSERTALSIKDLLSKDKYIIPRYQRNYAWGKREISQVIRDVNEFFHLEKDSNYYIGSLVCFKRKNGEYELIDGQQRYTTISLINIVLKHLKIKNVPTDSNLEFDSRKNVQQFLKELCNSDDLDAYLRECSNVGIQNFKAAIGFIREELLEKDFDVQKFAENFYDLVKLFRVEVPEDTDLNHYFEIMNNRGEQLEKHEIVKAHLMGLIKNEDSEQQKKEQRVFSLIWNACSDMSHYIHSNFTTQNKDLLFDDKGNLRISKYDDLIVLIGGESDENEKTLSDILADLSCSSEAYSFQDKTIEKEKYKSVIDFPNFLLQVLKLEIKDDKIPLDDKNMVKIFNNNEIEPKHFIMALLKYRILFDKYIIKRDLQNDNEESQNWGIRKLDIGKEYLTKTFEEDDELVKLQAMFYNADPSNTNNNWVQEILKTLDNNIEEKEMLETLSSKCFEFAKNKFDRTNLSYPEITIYNLYFIDFLLWKFYITYIKGKDDKENNSNIPSDLRGLAGKIKKDLFNNFRFKQLNSKEHLAPQANAGLNEISEEKLNCIGNLCLISQSQNSQGNKENPFDKKRRYEKDNSSLKRLIMFESFENDKWESIQIEKHEDEINKLLDYYMKK